MSQTHNWREALRVYTKPQILIIFLLGFSAGLPFLLVFSSLSAWLNDVNVSKSTIGFFSWIGLLYSIKVVWAPVVDKTPLPLLTKIFGQRRSWLLLAQSGIAGGILLMAGSQPAEHLQAFALFALLVAFSSATQDVVVDAYRIEAAANEYQAAMAASYVFGYRIATLAAGAGALYFADIFDWHIAYLLMAVLSMVGIITTLLIKEPAHKISADTLAQEEKIISQLEDISDAKGPVQKIIDWFAAAVISPFVDFFHRYGKQALIILLLVGSYRITDITMAVMANPFYLDMGFTKTEIAQISKLFGFALTLSGAALGGILVMRYGILKILLLGGLLVIGSNLLFALLSTMGANLTMLAFTISMDSLAGGIATAVFIAYLSSLTNTAYTATQYALFSSIMTLFPKIIAGFSGVVVEHFGYFNFYIYASCLGLPAIFIIVYLLRREKNSREQQNT